MRCTGLAQLSSRVGPVLQSFWEWPNTNTNELSRTSYVKSNLTTHANLWKTTTDWCSGCLLSLLCRWRSYPLFSKLSDIKHTDTSTKKKRQYEKVNDLWCSQAVTHPSTNHALLCLTSVIGRKDLRWRLDELWSRHGLIYALAHSCFRHGMAMECLSLFSYNVLNWMKLKYLNLDQYWVQ